MCLAGSETLLHLVNYDRDPFQGTERVLEPSQGFNVHFAAR